ncbi:hypothetical protein FEO89_04510 [Stenotrophomonas maltophilia]|nr:hypothetical protein FEO89_04510 [Stenotrophomonas maltophilia]
MENASRFERMERPLVVEPSIVARRPAPPRTPEVMQSDASTVQRLHCNRTEAGGQAAAGHAVNPAPRPGPAAGGCAFWRLRSSASQAKRPHPWGLDRAIHGAHGPASAWPPASRQFPGLGR